MAFNLVIFLICLFLSKDIVRRTECRKVQFRHSLIELRRYDVDVVLVGRRGQRGKRKDLLRLDVVDFMPSNS